LLNENVTDYRLLMSILSAVGNGMPSSDITL